MKKVKNIVKKLLLEKPETRDDDLLLISWIWWKEMDKITNEQNFNATFSDFLSRFKTGKLSTPESIRRARCKLQELNSNLRGLKYQDRQKHQAKWKNDLNGYTP